MNSTSIHKKFSAKLARRCGSKGQALRVSSKKISTLRLALSLNLTPLRVVFFVGLALTATSYIAFGAEKFLVMNVPKIKTYRDGETLGRYDFYILNKGNYSGKPGNKPWKNCFVAQCDSAEQRDYFYWICFGLQRCRRFEHLLVGSVIPFLRKHDLEWELDRTSEHIQQYESLFFQRVKAMDSFVQRRDALVALLNEQYGYLQYSLIKILKHK